MKQTAGILQQIKFMALILQMVLVSIIYETRTDEEDPDITKIRFICLLFWILGLLEFIIIFIGTTMFNNQFNMAMIFAHLVSIIMLVGFKNSYATSADFFRVFIIAG